MFPLTLAIFASKCLHLTGVQVDGNFEFFDSPSPCLQALAKTSTKRNGHRDCIAHVVIQARNFVVTQTRL